MNRDNNLINEWYRLVSLAWESAEEGRLQESREYYGFANKVGDHIIPKIYLCPETSILRHTQGKPVGPVTSLPPEENTVVSLVLPEVIDEAPDSRDMDFTDIKYQDLLTSFQHNAYVPPEYLVPDADDEQEHIMVLSAGRSGSVSLFRLFERTHYIPYHSYFFQVPAGVRFEVMCRAIGGYAYDKKYADFWLRTRAAEWRSAEGQGRPMIGLNHLDTVFAPIFARAHKKSKFIYLHRDPIETFKSFYSKNQWSEQQIAPMYYTFDPEFRYRRARYDIPETLAWYLAFTDEFCSAFIRSLPEGRGCVINANDLFRMDENEIKELKEFTGIDLSIKEIKRHFSNPYNQKLHKIQRTPQQIYDGTDAFKKAYVKFLENA